MSDPASAPQLNGEVAGQRIKSTATTSNTSTLLFNQDMLVSAPQVAETNGEVAGQNGECGPLSTPLSASAPHHVNMNGEVAGQTTSRSSNSMTEPIPNNNSVSAPLGDEQNGEVAGQADVSTKPHPTSTLPNNITKDSIENVVKPKRPQRSVKMIKNYAEIGFESNKEDSDYEPNIEKKPPLDNKHYPSKNKLHKHIQMKNSKPNKKNCNTNNNDESESTEVENNTVNNQEN